MKRIVVLLLAALMLLSACAKPAAQTEPAAEPTEAPKPVEAVPTEAPAPTDEPLPETRSFTDSVGRTVEIPYTLDKVAISGPLAQIVLFALCPDKLVGIANAWDKSAEKFFDANITTFRRLDSCTAARASLILRRF